jgi:transcriptional regulator with XRE-family HTH domain
MQERRNGPGAALPGCCKRRRYAAVDRLVSGARHDGPMPGRERATERASLRTARVLVGIGGELRDIRLSAGLRQADVARAVGCSQVEISRIERGLHKRLPIDALTRIAAAVGLDLSLRLYPAGPPLRDAAHLALLGRFRARTSPAFAWATEVPLPIVGDQRAFDGLLTMPGLRIAVEAEMRLRDIQALQRRLELKKRDGAVDRLILLVPDTRSNREAIRAAGASLAAAFPAGTRHVMSALAAGRDPGSDGWVVL